MRPFALALLLAACSSDPTVAPPTDAPRTDAAEDRAPVVDVPSDPCAGLCSLRPDTVCVAGQCVPRFPTDAAAEAAVDVAPAVDAVDDVAPPPDVARDTGPDAVTCGSPTILECNVDGVPTCVDVERGRMVGDHLVHCGACDVACRPGEICSSRRCQRL